MSYFEPNGILRLLAGVKISEGVTYRFSSRSAQTSFFEGKARVSFDELSYISHDGVVTLEVDPSVVKDCDYIMFQNPTQEGKWWYGKISGYRWINSAPTCEISYEIDWYQSYQFDIGYSMCTIEREGFSNEGYQAAVENPWSREVLEMCTPEDIIVTEEQFNVKPSVIKRWPNNGLVGGDADTVILMIMSDGWTSDLSDEELNKFNGAITASNAFYNEKPSTVNGLPNIMRFIGWLRTSSPQPVIDLMTLWGVTSEISSILYVPKIIVDNLANGYFSGDTLDLSIDKDTMHPKLNRHPFTVVTVMSPNGNKKNLKTDRFNTLANGLDDVQFSCATCAGSSTSYAVAPISYGDEVTNSTGINLNERVEFSDFAQVPYNVDSFLTYMSSQYDSSIMANNASQQFRMAAENALGDQYKIFGAVAADVGSLAGTVRGTVGAFLTGKNPFDNQIEPYAAFAQNEQNREIYNEAQRYRNSNPNDIKSSTALSFAKPACMADSYVAPSGGSFLSYVNGLIPTFAIYVRRMNDIYRKQIAQYFMRYGMKSNRIGIPYSANYSDMHFDSFRDAQVHFCKTSTCYIDCNNSVAEAAIESMYNGGVLFLNGG